MEGYVKVYRKLLDWEWYDKKVTRSLFQHCLLKANYRESAWHGATIPAGSFITSLNTLSLELDYSVREIRTAITHLKSTNDITTTTTSDYTMINVVNWAKYQGEEIAIDKPPTSTTTNERQATDKRPTIAEEVKKERSKESRSSTLKDLCDPSDAPLYRPTLDEVKSYCKERKNNVDPETWFNFYDSKGWLVGKTPMKKWKAAIRTWESKDKNEGITRPIDKIGKPKIGMVL